MVSAVEFCLYIEDDRRYTLLIYTCLGVATGTLVPSTSEDKPPTPTPVLTPPTGSEEAYDPHDYDEVAVEEAAAHRAAAGGQGNGLPNVRISLLY